MDNDSQETRDELLEQARNEMNMSIDDLDSLMSNESVQGYAEYHDENNVGSDDVETIIERAKAVIKGDARKEQARTVRNYLRRTKPQYSRGSQNKHKGMERERIALMTWGYDPKQ